MLRLKGTDIVIVAGERGTGKSTYLTRLYPRHVIYDALGEYGEAGFENLYIPGSSDS